MAETNGNGKSEHHPDLPDDLIAVYVGGAIKGRIHVLILNDDGSWFAHGIEADYSAEGTSLEDVRKRFEEGLTDSIRAYFKRDGNIFGAFRPAPDEYRKLYNEQTSKWCYTFKKKIDIAPPADDLTQVEVQLVTKEPISPAKAKPKPVAELELEFSTECVPAGCGT